MYKISGYIEKPANHEKYLEVLLKIASIIQSATK